MRWTERQRAMLGEIGISLWLPPERGAATEGIALQPKAVPESAARRAGASSVHGGVSAREEQDRGAALELPALAASAAACTACALCAGRTRAVFGAGNIRANWMIVGDAPDSDDDRQGEPFAGKAGQLLDNMLNAIQLTRGAVPPSRQVYVTHAVKCHPPGQRNPEPAEVAQCEPFLLRQVELVRPRIILAMGRVAVQGLLRSTEATAKLRGRVHRYAGVPLVATFHPAYLLRQAEAKAEAWDDLCLAVRTLKDASPG